MVFRKEGKEQRVYMPDDATEAVYNYIYNERKAVSDDVKALLSPLATEQGSQSVLVNYS